MARGIELYKLTRDLHWNIVSVYIHWTGKVILNMKSNHVVSIIKKRKKYVVLEVIKNITAWWCATFLNECQIAKTKAVGRRKRCGLPALRDKCCLELFADEAAAMKGQEASVITDYTNKVIASS
uniref:Pleckstrin-like plant domain-containing protein n=1 Tax=Tanacetum cinerariifolium TaxID=118510 RepID=A0A6L2LU75_TANCI|nr:hypothetical protein [Tanacetum cinerariifolium]